MTVTAYKTPGTCATVDRNNQSLWNTPDNAKTSNDSWTNCGVVKSAYSDWLRVTNFDFASAIPEGSTIDGIEVKIEHHGEVVNEIFDSALYLRKTSGQIGDNKASASYWPTSDAEVTYPVSGGATDKWGYAWLDTDIRSSDFGVDLSAGNADDENVRNAYVDVISIRVYYTSEGVIEGSATLSGTGTLTATASLILASPQIAYPGLGSTEDRDGKSVWNNPTDIEVEALYASSTILLSTYSDWLRASDFGFAIPSTAVIDGIKVEINRESSGVSFIKDSSLRLVDASGTNVGDDKASASFWPTSPATATYGGDSDTWGASPTPAMVNDSDFGIRLSAANIALVSQNASVYWVKITVYYTDGGAATLSGTGTLSATANLILTNTSSLSGVGSVTADGHVTRGTSASLSGAGTLTVSAYLTLTVSPALAGIGTLTAEATTELGLWVSPTSHDEETDWVFPTKAYDGDTGLYSYKSVPAQTWSSYLELYSTSVSSSKVRIWSRANLLISAIQVDVQRASDSVWVNIYDGSVTGGDWVEYEIGETLTIIGIRARYWCNTISTSISAFIHEADIWQATPAEVLGAASLSGAGTASVSGVNTLTTSGILAGVGSLTAIGENITQAVEGSATLAGAGTATVSGVILAIPTAIMQTTTDETITSARLWGQITADGGAVCQARFRYRGGVAEWTYTDWVKGYSELLGDLKYANLSNSEVNIGNSYDWIIAWMNDGDTHFYRPKLELKSPPAVLDGVFRRQDGKVGEYGNTVAFLYYTTYAGNVYLDVERNGNRYSYSLSGFSLMMPAKVVLTSEKDVWIAQQDVSGINVYHYELNATASLVSSYLIGDSESRLHDFIMLKSGALVLVWHQHIWGVNGIDIGFGYWDGEIWDVFYQFVVDSDFDGVQPASTVVLGQCSDESIWCFYIRDAHDYMGAIKLIEASGSIEVSTLYNPFITEADTDVMPAYEKPLIRTLTTENGIRIAYQGTRSDARWIVDMAKWVYPIVVVDVLPDATFSLVYKMPEWVERVSSFSLGEDWLAYGRINETDRDWNDLTFWKNGIITDAEYYIDISGLVSDLEYEVQTQPRNIEGEGAWSASDYFPTTHEGEGTAVLAGAGTLTGVGSRILTKGIYIFGEGLVEAIACQIRTDTTTISGVGTVSSIGYVIRPETASLAGVGTLTLSGFVTRTDSSALSGAGSVTASGVLIKTDVASLSGAGTLSAMGDVGGLPTGIASLSGVGTVAISASLIGIGAILLAGQGQISATGRCIFTTTVLLQGIGTIVANAWISPIKVMIAMAHIYSMKLAEGEIYSMEAVPGRTYKVITRESGND